MMIRSTDCVSVRGGCFNDIHFSKGLQNIDDLIESVRHESHATKTSSTPTPPQPASATTTVSPSGSSSKPKPRPEQSSGVRTLDQIVNLDMLRSEPRAVIETIWNEHHAQKKGVISGVMDKSFFDRWREAGRRYPMV